MNENNFQPVNNQNMNQVPSSNNKSNNTLIICITIIIVALIAGVSVYFLTRPTYSNEPKSSNKGDSTNQTTETTNYTDEKANVENTSDNAKTVSDNSTNTDNTNAQTNNKLNSNWINYLLNQNIIEAKLTVYQQKNTDVDSRTEKYFKLNKEELNSLLNKIADTKLVKKYSRGGGSGENLQIIYKKNNIKYKFTIAYDCIFIDDNDKDIVKLFDNNNYEENTENKGISGVYEYYEGTFTSIFEDYIK